MRAAALAEGASDLPPDEGAADATPAAAPVPSGFPGTFIRENPKRSKGFDL